jgi:hypothetical protein
MLVERQKWRRARRVDLAVRALDVFADLLRSLNDVIWMLQETSEQIKTGSPTEIEVLTRTISDRTTVARQALVMARLVGPPSAFPLVDELERQLTALRPLIADGDRAIGTEDKAAVRRSSDLVDAAEALMQLRDSVVSRLRRPDALRIDRRASRAVDRTRTSG